MSLNFRRLSLFNCYPYTHCKQNKNVWHPTHKQFQWKIDCAFLKILLMHMAKYFKILQLKSTNFLYKLVPWFYYWYRIIIISVSYTALLEVDSCYKNVLWVLVFYKNTLEQFGAVVSRLCLTNHVEIKFTLMRVQFSKEKAGRFQCNWRFVCLDKHASKVTY